MAVNYCDYIFTEDGELIEKGALVTRFKLLPTSDHVYTVGDKYVYRNEGIALNHIILSEYKGVKYISQTCLFHYDEMIRESEPDDTFYIFSCTEKNIIFFKPRDISQIIVKVVKASRRINKHLSKKLTAMSDLVVNLTKHCA